MPFEFEKKETYSLNEVEKLLEQQNKAVFKEVKTTAELEIKQKNELLDQVNNELFNYKIEKELTGLEAENAKVIRKLVGNNISNLETVKQEHPNLFKVNEAIIGDPFSNDKTETIKEGLVEKSKNGKITEDELTSIMKTQYDIAKKLQNVK